MRWCFYHLVCHLHHHKSEFIKHIDIININLKNKL